MPKSNQPELRPLIAAALSALLGLATAACAPYPAHGPLGWAQGGGRLALTVKGLGPRRLLATVDEVKTLKVTLTAAQVLLVTAFWGTELDQTGTPDEGRGTLTFDRLPPGPLTATITALDAAGDPLGDVQTTVTIPEGATATADVTLVLDDTHLPNPQGALHTHVTVQDGDTLTDPVAPAEDPADMPVLGTLTASRWTPAPIAGAYVSSGDAGARTITQDGVLFTIGAGAEMAGSGHFTDATHLVVGAWTGVVDEDGAIAWTHADPEVPPVTWEPA